MGAKVWPTRERLAILGQAMRADPGRPVRPVARPDGLTVDGPVAVLGRREGRREEDVLGQVDQAGDRPLRLAAPNLGLRQTRARSP